MFRLQYTSYVFTIVLIIFTSSCAYQSGNIENPGRGFNLVSQQTEIQMGQEAAQEIEKQETVMTQPQIQQYITHLGQNLVQSSRRPNLSYRFKVIDTDEINAFALPGGFIYVNRGLITEAQSEAELAGVLAHEIGHVAARHGAKRMSTVLALQLGFAVFESMNERERSTQIKLLIAQALATGFLLKNSRDNERQADDLGTENLYRASYDPYALASFFDVLSRDYSPSTVEVFLSTHPSPGERVRNVEALIATFPPKSYMTDSPQFQQIKQMLLSQSFSHSSKIGQAPAQRRLPAQRFSPGLPGRTRRR